MCKALTFCVKQKLLFRNKVELAKGAKQFTNKETTNRQKKTKKTSEQNRVKVCTIAQQFDIKEEDILDKNC